MNKLKSGLRRFGASRFPRVMALLLALCMVAGCLGEQSFPMVPERLVTAAPAQVERDVRRLATRDWAAALHAAAVVRLPAADRHAVLTDELRVATPAGSSEVINVWHRFNVNPARVDNLFWNWRGIEQTSQVASPAPDISDGHIRRPPWKGFHDVEVPVGKTTGGPDQVFLFARLGLPEKMHEIPGSYVIVTHGLFGSLDGFDMENHVQGLRRAGHHVLALEMRGHGETLLRHPEYAMTFGIRESADFLAAGRWLKSAHGATRVGLVSFSLTSYEALLTAWLDGTVPVRGFEGDPVMADLGQRGDEPTFNGGLFLVSTVIGITNLADRFEKRTTVLEAPVKATFQARVRQRLSDFHEPAGFSMWDLAKSDLTRAGYLKGFTEKQVETSLMNLIDMRRDNWQVGAARMENIRVPVLVLSAANDPLGTAQNVAELFGRVKNPNIGVILLKEGGHMGFSALSADYYYSLMTNFFDPRTGPAAP